MKKLIDTKGLATGTLFLLAGMVGSYALAAGIADTRHNLSSGSTIATSVSGGLTVKSTDQDEICIYCHTPHSAIKNDNITLWNKNLSTTAAGGYQLYTSPTLDATMQDIGGATAATATVTNLCLSCHDGAVAMNSLNNASNRYGNAAPTLQGALGTTTNLGTNLKDDHPVNFKYEDSTATDTHFNTVAAATTAGARFFNDGTKNWVHCASCHDPHTSADSYGGQKVAFLRTTMSGSALCLACHNK